MIFALLLAAVAVLSVLMLHVVHERVQSGALAVASIPSPLLPALSIWSGMVMAQPDARIGLRFFRPLWLGLLFVALIEALFSAAAGDLARLRGALEQRLEGRN